MAVAGSIVGAAGSMGGAMIAADAQRAAAAAQERIAAQNIAFQKDVYNQNVARVDPWVQYGTTQMNALAAQMPNLTSKYDMAKYMAGPEYQNTMAQTDRERNALMAKSSASGMYGSGTMANQLQANAAYLGQQGYQQGLQNYTNQNRTIYDMLNTGSNVGLNAAGQQNVAGANMASSVGSIYNNLGNAQARAQEGIGNAWGGAVSNLGQLGMDLGAQYQKKWDSESAMNSSKSMWDSFLDSLNPQSGASSFGNALGGGVASGATPGYWDSYQQSQNPFQSQQTYGPRILG